MKIAAVQFQATKDKKGNCQKAEELIVAASKKKVNFVALPELFVYRGSIKSGKELSSIAESINGPTIQAFQKIAKQSRVNVLAGSIYEKIKRSSRVYNASVLINQKGEIVSVYRKQNLFHASLKQSKIRESDVFSSGKKRSSTIVNRWKVGLSICYDLRFSQLYRRYATDKVELMMVPSNFTRSTGKDHWEVLLRARAIEGLCYVVAPNQVGGDDRGVQSYGNSMIISPWGEIIARASLEKEEIIYANLKKQAILRAKKILPGISS